MFSNKPNYTKLRTNLRLCINRLKLLEKKKTELALKARREIADYIAAGKEDRARIRVEHIVREDYLVEAMEIIEMLCDMLLARFGMIERMAELDPGIEEAVATILWVTPRMSADVQELQEVSRQLTIKYSKEFAQMCMRNDFQKANEKVIHKISLAAPPKILIENYMIEIAKSYKVPFEPDPIIMMGEPTAVPNLIDLGGGDIVSSMGSAGSGNPAFFPSSNNPSSAAFNPSASDLSKSFEAANSNPGAFGAGAFGPDGSGSNAFGPGVFSPSASSNYPGSQQSPNSSPSNPILPTHFDNLSPAERKHLEATGYVQHRRPPTPPGGGGQVLGRGLNPPYPTPGQNGGVGSDSIPEKSPIPSFDPTTDVPTHNAPHYGMHYNPFDSQMSWPDDQIPILPGYDEVMNSPTQYPATSKPTECQPNFLIPTEYPNPPTHPQPSPRSRSLTPLLPDVPADLSPDLPSVPGGEEGGFDPPGGSDVNFDDLTRRFEELKKRK